MKTLRRLIWREVVTSVAFATLAFLALFFFFDLLDELRWIGRSSGAAGALPWSLSQALLYVLLSQPKHFYELLPITVLIGTIFVMARLAQSSEFTIMRTSGLGPWRALSTLLLLGAAFTAITFAIGDYLAPASERAAQRVRALRLGAISTGATGAWLKERQGAHSFAVNVRAVNPNGQMQGVRIFEFDAAGRVVGTLQAAQADFADSGQGWNLTQVQRDRFESDSASGSPHVARHSHAALHWPSSITREMVATALLKPDRMATIDLFRYIRHLQANAQAAQRYEIEFWRKVFYPLSCLVMVVLALPFAYLHFRTGSIATYVFGGIMAGISFFLLNNVFGFAGNLHQWKPWLTAAAPGLIYSALSLTAFGWLVLRH